MLFRSLDPQSGTALEIGTSGDTVTVPSGVGLTLTDSTLLLPTTITSTTEVKTNKISPATGVAFALGDSGDTFTVPSGATIVNSGTATGFGGGIILQVLEDTTTTQISTTGTVFIAGGLSQAITPASTSNKIMIICSFMFTQLNSTKNAVATIFRDTTNLAGGDLDLARLRIDTTNNYVRECITILDAPSSTSEIVYTLQFKNYGSGGDARVHSADAKGSLVLMEVAG